MPHKSQILKLVVVVAAATILPAVLFGEARTVDGQAGGDPWRNFFLDFQTLVGGALAVFAAWLTVDKMESTDLRAQKRHEELVQLSLRADRLSIERLLFPQLSELRVIYKRLKQIELPELDNDFTVENDFPSINYYRASYFAAFEANPLVTELEKLLARPTWVSAERLFTGQMSFHVQILGELLAPLQRHCEQTNKYSNDGSNLGIFVMDHLIERWKEFDRAILEGLPGDIRLVTRHLEKVILEMDSLARTYRVPT
ncbi:hypothetical protein PDO_1910 [Rhizobium sp. PDO1-076]|uniref:hypothetical protein n=1 Tax=Rhizobium sp. PDO1-076 TaxID=1125979 RepID=UPI00024E35D7|nr:hypothetical protein [Rhizobium sp. PDO1-076]EHS51519.1 hypothetical protein PDO_1910 [Rhizobium sp. PDO1-076]